MITNISGLVWSRRELVIELVRRELKDRHAGQVVGVMWSFGHPVLLMCLYTVLFAYVFPARFALDAEVEFSANILAGIVCWLMFQDILTRAPQILLNHASLVKQIVFPVEVLPLKTAIACILPFMGGVLFAIGYSGINGHLSAIVIFLPVLLFIQLLAMSGIAYLLCVVGMFLKDTRDIIVVFNSINLFAQPILFNPYATPEVLQWIFMFNPFSYAVWCWQDLLYYGAVMHPMAWLIFPLGSVLLFCFGLFVFEKTRNSLGDNL